jgi:two-component system, chemotaxis family, chemotaxis protein CheY
MANILIVDDALFMRKILSDIFSEAGHKIVGAAENAKEAIELYKKLRPDIVTMDIIMPEIGGIDTLKAIKQILKSDKNAKIVIVSAMGQQDMVVESIQAGAKDFIVKPFQRSQITEAIARLLRD